jgi:hypothetical protein
VRGANLLGRWTRRFASGGALEVQAYYDRVRREASLIGDKLDTCDLQVQHSFRIGQASEPGQGAAVSLLLRRARNAGAVTGPVTEQIDSVPHAAAAQRVLIVDDDTEVRTLLSEQLRALGHTVIEAADGPTALELMKDEAPDLMLADFSIEVLNAAIEKAGREPSD